MGVVFFFPLEISGSSLWSLLHFHSLAADFNNWIPVFMLENTLEADALFSFGA